ncbi:hypothetical protein BDF14DRAFT_1784573 [Spinellus fusiger]|nr:hypothetical protein BDF14DRAFT_1784573 [Spinellus fusiger]
MNPMPNNSPLFLNPPFSAQRQSPNAAGFNTSDGLFYNTTPPAFYPPFQFSANGATSRSLSSQPQSRVNSLDFQLKQQASYQQMVSAYPQSQRSGSQDLSTSPSLSAQMAKRGQSKADRRAEHNAIERARRESLNTKFQQLAHTLPNLQNDSRPSKGTIIERTLDFVKHALAKEERYRHEIRELRIANRQLLNQLSHQTNKERINEKSSSGSVHNEMTETFMPSYSPSPNSMGASQHGSMMMDTSCMDPMLAKKQQQENEQSPWDNFPPYNPAFYDGSPLTTTASPMDEPSDDDNSLNGDLNEAPTYSQSFFSLAQHPSVFTTTAPDTTTTITMTNHNNPKNTMTKDELLFSSKVTPSLNVLPARAYLTKRPSVLFHQG